MTWLTAVPHGPLLNEGCIAELSSAPSMQSTLRPLYKDWHTGSFGGKTIIQSAWHYDELWGSRGLACQSCHYELPPSDPPLPSTLSEDMRSPEADKVKRKCRLIPHLHLGCCCLDSFLSFGGVLSEEAKEVQHWAVSPLRCDWLITLVSA